MMLKKVREEEQQRKRLSSAMNDEKKKQWARPRREMQSECRSVTDTDAICALQSDDATTSIVIINQRTARKGNGLVTQQQPVATTRNAHSYALWRHFYHLRNLHKRREMDAMLLLFAALLTGCLRVCACFACMFVNLLLMNVEHLHLVDREDDSTVYLKLTS
jgi:hypothetical protein